MPSDPLMARFLLRKEVREADEAAVREIVAATGFFRPDEVDVAAELVRERRLRGPESGYFFVFADAGGRTVGYACYGPIACTIGSFDLYWIAVHPDYQGQGLGRLLMRAAEEQIALAGGRHIYVETSSRDQYHPTRTFYEAFGYAAAATLAALQAVLEGAGLALVRQWRDGVNRYFLCAVRGCSDARGTFLIHDPTLGPALMITQNTIWNP
jgi:GNAT superfamily N-acetyltransferase